MFRSKKPISTDNLQQLESDLDIFLGKRNKVYCKALRRPVKDAYGKTIVVHLREETHKKDRKLFFISCFQFK